jgi:exonuclease SbcD
MFALLCATERVDAAVIPGDLFDTRHPDMEEVAVVAGFLRAMRGVCPLLITSGNHDGPSRVADPGSHTLAWARALDMEGVTVALEPSVTDVGGAWFLSVPYPHRRAYDQRAAHLGLQDRHEAASRALDEAVRGMHEQWRPQADRAGKPLILVGHLTVAGARVGSERAMRLEDDLSLGSDAADSFDAALLGHIHLGQRVGRRGFYAGSPEYVDFGEAGQPKRFLVIDVRPGAEPVAEEHPTGCRPMAVLSDPDEQFPPGAVVRLDLPGPATRSERAAHERALYARGARWAEVRAAEPGRPAPGPRALPSDADPVEAARRWLAANQLPEEPYLEAVRGLVSGG